LAIDAFFVSSPVLFRIEYFYVAVVALPLLVAVVCIILYATKSLHIGGIPFYGDLAGLPLQLRVFNIGMTFESVFFLFFSLIRDHILLYTVEKQDRVVRKLASGLLIVVRICAIFACFALLVLAQCPPAKVPQLHTVAAILYVSSLGYFGIGDVLAWRGPALESILSVAATALGIAAAVIWAICKWEAQRHGPAAVFGYVIALVFFLKPSLIKVEIPPHGIQLTRRLIYNDKSE
jgi:hypothetical protein